LIGGSDKKVQPEARVRKSQGEPSPAFMRLLISLGRMAESKHGERLLRSDRDK
jgi:hypothetical protein